MNGQRLNVLMEPWQVEKVANWLGENNAAPNIFLIAVPVIKEARLEIVGWSGESAYDAHKAFRGTLMQHFPGSASQDAAQGGSDKETMMRDAVQDLMDSNGAMIRDLEAIEIDRDKWRAEAERLRDELAEADASTARTEDWLRLAQTERDESRAECERLRSLEAKAHEHADRLAENARHLLDENQSLVKENASQRAEVERTRAALAELEAIRKNFNAGWERVATNTRQDAA